RHAIYPVMRQLGRELLLCLPRNHDAQQLIPVWQTVLQRGRGRGMDSEYSALPGNSRGVRTGREAFDARLGVWYGKRSEGLLIRAYPACSRVMRKYNRACRCVYYSARFHKGEKRSVQGVKAPVQQSRCQAVVLSNGQEVPVSQRSWSCTEMRNRVLLPD